MKKELELLINKVEKCHEDDEFKGYKASPLLKEMVKLLEDNYQEAVDVLASGISSDCFNIAKTSSQSSST